MWMDLWTPCAPVKMAGKFSYHILQQDLLTPTGAHPMCPDSLQTPPPPPPASLLHHSRIFGQILVFLFCKWGSTCTPLTYSQIVHFRQVRAPNWPRQVSKVVGGLEIPKEDLLDKGKVYSGVGWGGWNWKLGWVWSPPPNPTEFPGIPGTGDHFTS